MMIKYISILLLIILSVLSFNCERDLTSSSDYSKVKSIRLNKPGGGEKYKSDQSIDIEWTTYNLDEALRIELINDDQSVYSVNDIPNTGHYNLPIPPDIVPSKKYQLRIESMIHPNIFDMNQVYFEIIPIIDGHWYFLRAAESTRLEIDLTLSDFVNNTFTGNGEFRFTYQDHGDSVVYESLNTIGGILSFPDVSFYMRDEAGKEFDFTGKMINNSEIHGRIIGFIDPVYGSLNDTLTLVRQ